jgi:hypothetical protein
MFGNCYVDDPTYQEAIKTSFPALFKKVRHLLDDK